MSDDTFIPEGYRFSKDHEWIKRDEGSDNVVVIGITDFAQNALGDIVHVDLPEIGEEFSEGDEVGVIESAKSASEVYSPLNGKLVAINDGLDEHPEYVNESPYDKGWIVKIEMSDPDDLDNLLSPEGYKSFLEDEN